MQTSTTHTDNTNKTVIKPPSGWQILDVDELWYYRDLLLGLVWRNLKVRYKQTILGASWAVLQPLITMVLFTIIFGNIAQISTGGVPYPIFSYSGLVIWTFFASGLSASAQSVTSNVNMLKKIYFPRVIYPISNLLSSLVDMIPSFIVLILMIIGAHAFLDVPLLENGQYSFTLSWNIIWTLPLTVWAFATALGVGLWLSALNVQFRDVRYATNFIVRLWLYITPVIYPSDLIAENYRFLYYLNPMAGVVDAFRWAVIGTDRVLGSEIYYSLVVTIIVLITGLIYFDRMEKSFADVA